MPSRETYVQSGDWIKFRDENQWRYAPPYDPRNDARPRRLAPPTNFSNRRGNRGASGRSKAPVLNMNSNGDFQVMKYGKGKSLPGYEPLPVVDTRIKMPSRSQLLKAFAHLGFTIATRGNPYAQIAYTAADVAYTFYQNGWFDNVFSGGSWGLQPATEGVPGQDAEVVPAPGQNLEFAWTCSNGPPSQPWIVTVNPNFSNSCFGDLFSANEFPGDVVTEIEGGRAGSYVRYVGRNMTTNWEPNKGYITTIQGWRLSGFIPVSSQTIGTYYPAVEPVPAVLLPRPLPDGAPPLPALSEVSYNDPIRRKALKKYELPAVEVSSDGGKSPPRITTHVRSKPGRGEREKKGQIDRRLAQRVIAALYDATTEASDFVDIAYDALKKGHKCRGAKSMSDKAWCVYQNIEHIDVTELAYGLVYNHFEDKYIGSIFGKVGKKTKYGTLMYGGYIPSPF